MKKIILPFFFFATCFFSKAQSGSSVTPQQVCEVTTAFLNELINGGQYTKLLGSIYSKTTSYGLELREYNSLQNFPNAKRTIIIDTNKLSRYRSAKMLMFSETVSTEGLTKTSAQIFNIIGEVYKACLVPQKFEADYSEDIFKQHKLKMSYKFEIPSANANPFANMQAGSTLEAQIYIDQIKNKEGTFTNEVYIHFKRT